MVLKTWLPDCDAIGRCGTFRRWSLVGTHPEKGLSGLSLFLFLFVSWPQGEKVCSTYDVLPHHKTKATGPTQTGTSKTVSQNKSFLTRWISQEFAIMTEH
jgi:hypothetical protein